MDFLSDIKWLRKQEMSFKEMLIDAGFFILLFSRAITHLKTGNTDSSAW